jgi:ribosomal protein S18 acetylase RimI-like enzyme
MSQPEPRRHEGDISHAHMALLREADPDDGKIAAYLASGEVWVSAQGDAIAIIQQQDGGVFEIMNIALEQRLRGQGHGKAFLLGLVAMIKARGGKAVEIGTGNSSLDQLALYQKAGFRIIGIVRGFFDTYPEPIVENGIACRDMVRLRLAL